MNDLSSMLIGLVSGVLISWFNFRYIWINQKIFEAKFAILDDAAKALGLYEREYLEPEIQYNKRKFIAADGSVQIRAIELSAETDILITKTLVKTKAMYSKSTYMALYKALNTNLNIKEPSGDTHIDFINCSDIAIEMMGDELKSNVVLRNISKIWKKIF